MAPGSSGKEVELPFITIVIIDLLVKLHMYMAKLAVPTGVSSRPRRVSTPSLQLSQRALLRQAARYPAQGPEA
jgi:hypothetical protein